ncbi:ATP-binding Cassette (ABC) Superfamily [Thraustotheca clavata]|uniref:ATP-binding Cassette (ABC) Superfamily n=1 Tax=Thraustotheca clavata TaxID=74557 RepID=A0A1W0ACE7_9STRA|nr:ATP-binding Cassette (ABC) Superfamily [Thraustotheca clavata]
MKKPMPQMEISFTDLSTKADVVLTTKDGHELPTLVNHAKKIILVLKPSSTTLLLGQPGSGKSSLMKFLSGRFPMHKNISVGGQVSYNGKDMASVKKVLPQFTAYETIAFAHASCGGAIVPPRFLNALNNKTSEQNQHAKDIIESTIVGDGMLRGVSGGELSFMDKISTGLDSAATYDIVKFQKSMASLLRKTIVIALLQPPPEPIFYWTWYTQQDQYVVDGATPPVTPAEYASVFRDSAIYKAMMTHINGSLDTALIEDANKFKLEMPLQHLTVFLRNKAFVKVELLLYCSWVYYTQVCFTMSILKTQWSFLGLFSWQFSVACHVPGVDLVWCNQPCGKFFVDLGFAYIALEYVRYDAPENVVVHLDEIESKGKVPLKTPPKNAVIVNARDPIATSISVTLAFKDLWYSVPNPKKGEPELKLLKGINGYAAPGTVAALMGSSGAGKTTHMDVIAGRKTGGKIEGQIFLNSYPATDLVIRRGTGYCEQMGKWDARSAKIIMSGIRKIASTGRTVFVLFTNLPLRFFKCLITFYSLNGVETVFFGPLGENSNKLIEYFSGIPNTLQLQRGANPATWMLECIGAGVEARHTDGEVVDYVKLLRKAL